MTRGWKRLLGASLLLVTSGCQCCWLTEDIADCVDHCADNGIRMEHCYRADWDINRIGHPDWCCNPHNRAMYPCECNPFWKEFGPYAGYPANTYNGHPLNMGDAVYNH